MFKKNKLCLSLIFIILTLFLFSCQKNEKIYEIKQDITSYFDVNYVVSSTKKVNGEDSSITNSYHIIHNEKGYYFESLTDKNDKLFSFELNNENKYSYYEYDDESGTNELIDSNVYFSEIEEALGDYLFLYQENLKLGLNDLGELTYLNRLMHQYSFDIIRYHYEKNKKISENYHFEYIIDDETGICYKMIEKCQYPNFESLIVIEAK